jgi:hypothetical protein
MLLDRDIERAADFLRRLHGFDAHRVAACRASQLLREGEINAGELWLRIATRLSMPPVSPPIAAVAVEVRPTGAVNTAVGVAARSLLDHLVGALDEPAV